MMSLKEICFVSIEFYFFKILSLMKPTAVKKALKILRRNGFREPYQIIADSSFIKAANRCRVHQEKINELLKSEPKLLITKCGYELHKQWQREKDFSGCCRIVKCGHEKVDEECGYKFIKEENPNHYILASNDSKSVVNLKSSKRIPVIRILKNELVIDCNQMPTDVPHEALGASKSELRHLKKMFS